MFNECEVAEMLNKDLEAFIKIMQSKSDRKREPVYSGPAV